MHHADRHDLRCRVVAGPIYVLATVQLANACWKKHLKGEVEHNHAETLWDVITATCAERTNRASVGDMQTTS